MTLKIVVIFTILSIFGEYKGVQCQYDISMYMDAFSPQAFDEFNLVCYVSMYSTIDRILTELIISDDNIGLYILNLANDISRVYTKLLQLNGWLLFLENPSLLTNINIYIGIKDWFQDFFSNASIESDVLSTLNGTKFSKINIDKLQTLKAKNVFEIIYSTNYETSEKSKLFQRTFEFCKDTLSDLSSESQRYSGRLLQSYGYDNAISTIMLYKNFGSIISVMTEDEFDYFYQADFDNKKMLILIVIEEALQDIFKGMVHILTEIDVSSTATTHLKSSWGNNHTCDLFKMIMTLYYNAHGLAGHTYFIKELNGVNEKLQNVKMAINTSYVNYDYNEFMANFQETWESKFITIQEQVNSTIPNDYAIYGEAWDNIDHIVSSSVTDHKKIFLMELNGWTNVLYALSNDLLFDQTEGRHGNLFQNENFLGENTFINEYIRYFFEET